MLNRIYFCLFCPQKFETNDDNKLKEHLIHRHFDAKSDPVIEEWVKSLVNYQTELNYCLSSEPKSLPKSSMCQSMDVSNNGKQKLLKGCGLCDRIIQCFKLDINFSNKKKSVCVCGGGKEVNKVVVICHNCKHLYHYQCVEPTGYSGQETALYKCLKCKPKDFEISDLSSESQLSQPIHVNHHFHYQPFVCKVDKPVGIRRIVCNETFFLQNFLKTHLKCEHKLTPNGKEVFKYIELHSIPKVQHLIDSTFKKLSQNNSSHQSIPNQRQCQQINDNSMTNKRIRTETTDGRTAQIIDTTNGHNSNDSFGPPPLIEPVSANYRNNSKRGPPQLVSATSSRPPILVNNFNERHSLSNNNRMPPKRGRGRPKGSKSKAVDNHQISGSHSNNRNLIPPNRYVADGNPHMKSRLSVESRLSRPNISLSREQEKALNNKTNKTNGNKRTANQVYNEEEDSSDWDSDPEMIEKIRGSSQRRTFNSHSEMATTPVSSQSQSNANFGQKSKHSLTTSVRRSHNEESSDCSESQQNSCRIGSQTLQTSIEAVQTTDGIGSDNSEESSDVHIINEEEEVLLHTNVPKIVATNESQPTAVEADNQPIETERNSPLASSLDMNLQNGDQPIVNQTILSDWLFHTKPKKFPYFPQINDEVIYIPYGHRLYIDSVRQLGLYRQTNTTKWLSSDYINDKLLAKVKEIKFEKHSNVRLAKLTLKLIDNNVETKSFNVKFHDIDNVLDFIILKQNYDNSLMRNWKIADIFRAIIEDKWWFGEIHSYNMKDSSLTTHFQGLNIVWGNGTTDVLSFWDLEPVYGELPKNRNVSIDVTDEDRNLFYVSEVQEWPVCGKEEECKRITNGLTQVMELNEYKELMKVFDPSNSDYLNRVPYLINLSIIRDRVRNMFYRRHEAIKFEIKYLSSNASILDPNRRKGVLMNAQIVVSVCLKFIDEHRAQDIQHIYRKVIQNPNSLDKIKYYACTRPHLNHNPNIVNPLIASTCAQVLNLNDYEPPMNILTPSTTRPIVNSIRRSNESDFSVIELSDDSEDDNRSEPNEVFENRTEDTVISQTCADSPPMPVLESQVSNSKTRVSKQTSKPIVPVRAQPIEQRSSQKSTDVFKRYFCIFCNEKFVIRDEAMDHYSKELKIKLNCSLCPQNHNFESLEHYLSHDSKHIKQMKLKINSKTYLNIKTWIESIIEFMDSLLNPIIAQNQIHQKYGDCCIVCQRINVLTVDSQPFYHKSVFANNRISMKNTIRSEVEFAQHLKKHLKYEPLYNCTLCAANNSTNVFTSSAIDEKCGQHLQTVHKLGLQTAETSVVTSFFGNNKIPDIDHIIPDAVNLFIINCSDF